MKEIARSPSMIGVGVTFLIWAVLAFGFPAWSGWLFDLQPALTNEGRIEVFENLLVLVCMVGWIRIARRVRSRRRPLVVACAMVAQLVIILVEELDWGRVFGLPQILPERNLRMTLRAHGLLSPGMDPDAFVAFLILFFLSPLVPIARFRAWWDGAAPARADRAEALAAVVAFFAFLAFRLPLHERCSFEVLQTSEYVVLACATWRITAATRSS